MNTNVEKKDLNTSSLKTDNSSLGISYRTIIDLIKNPVITEKSYLALSKSKNKQYTFDVDLHLTKPQIKKIFENHFNVKIIAINTHIPPRKKKRIGNSQGNISCLKRVIITLKEGQSLRW